MSLVASSVQSGGSRAEKTALQVALMSMLYEAAGAVIAAS